MSVTQMASRALSNSAACSRIFSSARLRSARARASCIARCTDAASRDIRSFKM